MTTTPASTSSSRPARRKCYRCDSPSTLLLRKTVASCTPCALKAVDARTRPLLELARGAALLDTNGFLDGMSDRGTGSSNGAGSSGRPRGAVALAFSGGPSSRALLDIAVRSLSPPPISIDVDPSSSSSQQNGKRRPVDVTRLHIIYIDDSALYGGSSQDQTDEVRSIVESYGGAAAGINFVPVKLEEIFEDGNVAVEQLVLASQEEAAAGRPSSRIRAQKRPHTTSASVHTSLLSLFNTLSPTTTAARSTLPAVRTRFETLHHSLLQHLLRRIARHRLGCSSLLLGESATRSSVRMLSSLAVGAGHKWAVEGAEGGVWMDDLLVLRPMKETLDKEVAFYVKYKALRCAQTRNLVGPPAAGPASIGRLTQSFIAALEKGVPSTVSTVGRTGSKLVLKEAGSMSSLGESLLPGRGSFDDVVRGKSGVGQKGDRLMATVLKDTQRWTWRRTDNTSSSSSSSAASNGQPASPRLVVLPCPLCGLPAQEGAGRWRQKITIRQQDAGEDVDANGEAASSPSSSVNLDEMLCYPCLSLFLDAAQAQTQPASAGEGLLLPTHVLRFVEERRRYAQGASGHEEQAYAPQSLKGEAAAAAPAGESIAADDDLDASADGGRRRAAAAVPSSANGSEGRGADEGAAAVADAESVAILRRHATRRLDKQDMQGKIGDYLLDEEEESAP